MSVVLLRFAVAAHASTLVINNIETNNFLPKEIEDATIEVFSVTSTSAYSVDYAPDVQKFQITILQPPYEENRKAAEQAFVEKTGYNKK
ncbi:MAG: hypothetical protein UZ22_OP11002000515 [Microgenomates bacterium OLB23]|nr:MAG: hypothetical protein UZ22_OP11002000515 [Microgenomates bacterium OLB23]